MTEITGAVQLRETLLKTLSERGYTLQNSEAPFIALTMDDYGDLPVIIFVGDKQITAEVVLCPVSQVKDEAAADDAFMRLQKPLPLSSIGKSKIGTSDHYVCFGALSAQASFEELEYELVQLAQNSLEVAELIESELTPAA